MTLVNPAIPTAQAHACRQMVVMWFYSQSSNLVANDSNATIIDVFLRDRLMQTTELISLGNDGQAGDGGSYADDISHDGRLIIFSSVATNFTLGDSFNTLDVFLYDTLTHQIKLISATPLGYPGNGGSSWGSISSDNNRFIVFHSAANNLTATDTNNVGDIFVYDLQTQFMYCASINDNSEQGNLYSRLPTITPDGFTVAFESDATNLVPNDTNEKADIFVHHWQLYDSYLPIIISP